MSGKKIGIVMAIIIAIGLLYVFTPSQAFAQAADSNAGGDQQQVQTDTNKDNAGGEVNQGDNSGASGEEAKGSGDENTNSGSSEGGDNNLGSGDNQAGAGGENDDDAAPEQKPLTPKRFAKKVQDALNAVAAAEKVSAGLALLVQEQILKEAAEDVATAEANAAEAKRLSEEMPKAERAKRKASLDAIERELEKLKRDKEALDQVTLAPPADTTTGKGTFNP